MTAQERITADRPVPTRFTAEEFMELAQSPPIRDWPGKVELVDGEIIRMSPMHVPHWSAQQSLNVQLLDILRKHGGQWMVGTEATVKLATGTVRIADIAVVRTPDPSRQGILERDDLLLAIEVADTTLRTDLGRKLRDYAAGAVPHYWVVDLKKRETHVMNRPEGNGYAERRIVPHGEPIPVPGTDSTMVLT